MTKFLTNTVAEEFGLKLKYKGFTIGVEVELEVDKEPPVVFGWSKTRDGSLRGISAEYVSQPLSYEESKKFVNLLYSMLQENNVNIKDSMRAGVHIHVNFQDKTVKQLLTFIAAYYALEELFMEKMGSERKGNLFCLRLSDAEYPNNCILADTQNKELRSPIFRNENFRYGAMNLVSLSKFGTIEFRALKTPLTPEKIINWIETLYELYNNCLQYNSPASILNAMSANGTRDVIRSLLAGKAEQYLTSENVEEIVFDSIRHIQHWVFLTDWSSE